MATLHGKKIKLFSLNSNLELAQEIADYINVPLSKCEINRFSDGEVQVNIEENAARPVPAWLERDNEKLSGKVVRLSAREDIDLPIEEHLIVELYSK